VPFSQILRTSRPRFWIYLLGPFLVGHAILGSGYEILTNPLFWMFFIYFTFPANLFVYGINDIYDYETDKANPKKSAYEDLLTPENQRIVAQWILYTNLPFLILSVFLSPLAQVTFLAFLFFSWQYSALPIRAKAVPIVDSLFNVLYIFPGLIAFLTYPGATLRWEVVISALCWAMAMHAYSAIPDISADRKAGIQTVGTFLGHSGTLIFCTFLYGLAYILIVPYLGDISHILGGVYLGMMIISAFFLRNIFRVYTLFPQINTLMGFVLFWYIFV